LLSALPQCTIRLAGLDRQEKPGLSVVTTLRDRPAGSGDLIV
jgi:hypothetical protein